MKRAVILAAVGASTLAMSACATRVNYEGFEPSSAGGTPMKTLAALICPDHEGALVRTAQAGDGKSCDYLGSDGETVRLKLLDLDGRSAPEALAPAQAELRTLLPLPFKPIPAISNLDEGERADVDLPFFHVHTINDRSDVKIFGVTIHDDGKNAEVSVKKGGKHTVVHATPAGAEVVAEDVGRTNAELVYVLASDRRGPGGWRAVGYVAKGPSAGPLVVGEFRAMDRNEGERHRHGDSGDLDHLIDRNLKS
jgi:hypothetical protein